MTGLLVSVRDEDEALAALRGGADWIDVKEPSRGALGRADPDVIAKIVSIVKARRPVSAALGELSEVTSSLLRQLPKGLELVKIGLARCAYHHDWRDTWAGVAAILPTDIALAAVVYADWRLAEAPSPREILQTGRSIGCRALLVDTFDKGGPSSLECWASDELTEFSGNVRDAGLRLVLAGSLTLNDVCRTLPLAPDLLAVRGAVCRGGREGTIDAERVRELVTALESRRIAGLCDTVHRDVVR
ncbi:MAG: (5-formylfuran-3-yl)methyl phosphate synthase [Pirellulales bacterium]|nr:(5-formylfuran-3-yl)methyl phosphate synthase [Pirellulales bacterium]